MIALACAVAGLAGCGSELYLNQDYSFDTDAPIKLAMVPFYGSLPVEPDTLFTLVFSDTTGRQELVTPRRLRQKIDHDPALKDLLAVVVSKDYSSEEKKGSINIKQLIGEDGMQKLSDACEQADVVLVPVQLFVGPHQGRLLGVQRFRLFDLASGLLIYENYEDLNTDLGYPDYDKHMTLTLIGMVYSDYEKYFLMK
jgi:hypothetical protein